MRGHSIREKNKKFQKCPKLALPKNGFFMDMSVLGIFWIGFFLRQHSSLTFYHVSRGRAKHQFVQRFPRAHETSVFTVFPAGARNISLIPISRIPFPFFGVSFPSEFLFCILHWPRPTKLDSTKDPEENPESNPEFDAADSPPPPTFSWKNCYFLPIWVPNIFFF